MIFSIENKAAFGNLQYQFFSCGISTGGGSAPRGDWAVCRFAISSDAKSSESSHWNSKWFIEPGACWFWRKLNAEARGVPFWFSGGSAVCKPGPVRHAAAAGGDLEFTMSCEKLGWFTRPEPTVPRSTRLDKPGRVSSWLSAGSFVCRPWSTDRQAAS